MTAPETPGANDDVGTLAPRCPACGWQAHGLPDTLANSIVQRNAVMSHRDECPGSEPCVCGTPFTCLASTHEVDDTPVCADEQTPGANERAAIMVDVYPAGDGFRWRIKSSARGRRILSVASESYHDKASAFRSLLLTTGGEYTRLFYTRNGDGHVHEQGVIVRGIVGGLTEEIFVEYVSCVKR